MTVPNPLPEAKSDKKNAGSNTPKNGVRLSRKRQGSILFFTSIKTIAAMQISKPPTGSKRAVFNENIESKSPLKAAGLPAMYDNLAPIKPDRTPTHKARSIISESIKKS